MTLIRNARVFGGDATDLRFAGDRITECGTGLRAIAGEDEIDAHGGWLLPGLHDHHIHLRSLAAQSDSLKVGPPVVDTAEALAEAVRAADRRLPPEAWVRGIGYHESVAGDLDRTVLDELMERRPLRIQHRSGALWVLNSAACRLLDVEGCALPGVERDPAGRATGRLWRMDSWLGGRVPTTPADPAALSARAAAWGVTGFTDATPGMRQHEIDSLAAELSAGRLAQRVHAMTPPGIVAPAVDRFTLGPTKILLDDTTLPEFDDYAAELARIHAAGKTVAVHCVTRVQLILTLTALDVAGIRPGDRIEHGAIIPAESLAALRDRGLVVVTQPQFPAERAEQYAREVPAQERPDLWRLGSLIDAGVAVAAGTDAPFGGADPWRVIRAATEREPTSAGAERISPHRALSLFLGRADRPTVPRGLDPGEPADLTLLRVPPEELSAAWTDATPATATIVAGTVVHHDDSA